MNPLIWIGVVVVCTVGGMWLAARAVRWAKKGSKAGSMLAAVAFPFPDQPPPQELVERSRSKKGAESGGSTSEEDVGVLANRINAALDLKVGTLRFWGHWFGRPYDNQHKIVDCHSEGNSLVLDFDGAETLRIENPSGVQFGPDMFSIADATAVRWEWYYYGRPHTPENCYFYEFVRDGSGIVSSTNVDWHEPKLSLSPEENAVEVF